ncbi:uncharacterized protein VP01_2314g2, partial [Puccinia sorghi]
EFDLLDCKSNSMSPPVNFFTMPIQSEPSNVTFNYCRGVGLIQYLVQCTRPDSAFAFNVLTHTLQYIQHSKSYGLTLGRVKTQSHVLVAYSDASYATATAAHSISGSALFYNAEADQSKQRKVSSGLLLG